MPAGYRVSEPAAIELGALVRRFRGSRENRRARRGFARRDAASPRIGTYVSTVVAATSTTAGKIKVRFDALRTDDRSYGRAEDKETEVYVLAPRSFAAGERVECRLMTAAFDASGSQPFNRPVWIVSEASDLPPNGAIILSASQTQVTTPNSVALQQGSVARGQVQGGRQIFDTIPWADPLDPGNTAYQGFEILIEANYLLGFTAMLEISTDSGESLNLTGNAENLCDKMVIDQALFSITLNDNAIDPTGGDNGLQKVGDGSNPLTYLYPITVEKRCGFHIKGYVHESFPFELEAGDKIRLFRYPGWSVQPARLTWYATLWAAFLGEDVGG